MFIEVSSAYIVSLSLAMFIEVSYAYIVHAKVPVQVKLRMF